MELGLHRAGHEPEMLCEIWEPAQEVLRAHFDGVDLASDVCSLAGIPECVDLVTAGFPCQDLSQAGKTQGITGARSGLVDHVFRLLDQRPIEWVLLENVPFMLRLDGGRAMSTLVREFEARGYRWAYRVVNSQSFLPQRRERVFFLASHGSIDPADVVLADEVEPHIADTDLDALAHGFYWTEGLRGLGWAVDAVPPLKNGSTLGIPSAPAIIRPNGAVITPDIRDAERLQGFSEDWTKHAENVVRPSLRWSLVGNAVTVDAANWIGRRLNDIGDYSKIRDRPFEDRKWPRAARFDGEKRIAVEINSFPEWNARKPLNDFLKYPGKPLSVRATRGFLSRTDRAKLRFPEGFQARLRNHLATLEADNHLDIALKTANARC